MENEGKALLLSSLAVICILVLWYFLPYLELPPTRLDEISLEKLNKKILVLGRIEKANNYEGGSASVLLADENGTHLTVFIPYFLNGDGFRFKRGWCMEALGDLQVYKGVLELTVEDESGLRMYKC